MEKKNGIVSALTDSVKTKLLKDKTSNRAKACIKSTGFYYHFIRFSSYLLKNIWHFKIFPLHLQS